MIKREGPWSSSASSCVVPTDIMLIVTSRRSELKKICFIVFIIPFEVKNVEFHLLHVASINQFTISYRFVNLEGRLPLHSSDPYE